jgi:hypothetical protein
MQRIIYALQNGTGAVLSKLAIISIPFLLSAIAALLGSALEARDHIAQQATASLDMKVDGLSHQVDDLVLLMRDSSDRAATNQGDLRELRAQVSALEKRFDERVRR